MPGVNKRPITERRPAPSRSQAASATVFFWQNGHHVDITVEDDGIGASTIEEDIGISGMRERAQRVNGAVTILPVKIGFKIKLTLPLHPEASSQEGNP